MKLKTLAIAAAGVALAAGTTVIGAAPSQAQTITGYYCSTAVAVPGLSGSAQHCVSWALSRDSLGNNVAKPYGCLLNNNTNGYLNWYREAYTFPSGTIMQSAAYGQAIPPGTTSILCTNTFTYWVTRGQGYYMRMSLVKSGNSTGTIGLNVVSP